MVVYTMRCTSVYMYTMHKQASTKNTQHEEHEEHKHGSKSSSSTSTSAQHEEQRQEQQHNLKNNATNTKSNGNKRAFFQCIIVWHNAIFYQTKNGRNERRNERREISCHSSND